MGVGSGAVVVVVVVVVVVAVVLFLLFPADTNRIFENHLRFSFQTSEVLGTLKKWSKANPYSSTGVCKGSDAQI